MKKRPPPTLRYLWYTPSTTGNKVTMTGRKGCPLKLWGA